MVLNAGVGSELHTSIPMDQSDLIDLLAGSARSSDGTFAMRHESTFPMDRASDESDESMRSAACQLVDLLGQASNGSARAALRAMRLLRERIDELEREAVVVARNWGWSWRGIGYTLGVRAQTVHARYARDPRCRPRGAGRINDRRRLR